MRTKQPGTLPFRVLPIADRVEEEILARARDEGGVALGVGLLTIRDLERRLFAAAKLAPIDPLAAEILVGEVAPAAARGTCFERVAGEPGFPRAFLAAWDALREGGCSRAELARIEQRLSGLTRRRVAGILRIAAAYDAALAERGLVDAAGARLALLDALETMELPPELLRAEGIEIEDVIDLPVVRVRLLAALARRGLRVIYRMPALEGRAGLAASLEALGRQLEAEGRGVEVVPKRYGGGALAGFHARLFDPDACPSRGTQASDRAATEGPAQLSLFDGVAGPGGQPSAQATVAPVRRPIAPFDGGADEADAAPARAPVRVVEGDDEAAELRAVVRRVRELLGEGVPPDEIWIAARGLATLRGRLVEALERAGIPWRDRRGLPALEVPPVAVALALLRAAERRFPREELADLLVSRYVAGGVEDEAGYLPPRQVVRLLRSAASRDDGGEGHGAALLRHARRLAAKRSPEAEDAARIARHLSAWLEPLRLPERATPAEHVQRFAAAVEAAGIVRRCRAVEEVAETPAGSDLAHPIDRAAARAVARDQAGLRALQAALAQVAGAARRVGLADRAISLTRFRELLETALAASSLPARGARGGAVRLVDATELPGRRCDHLILAGVVDGRFPARRASEPLLEESDREAIAVAAGRSIFRWRAAEEPLLFALSTMAARMSLLVTASRLDGDGRELPRSPFLVETLRAAGREAPERAEAAAVPPAPSCTHPLELEARAAFLAAGGQGAKDEPPLEAIAGAVGGDRIERALAAARSFLAVEGHGRLGDPAAIAVARERLRRGAERFGPHVAWATSASTLESYATCPFRFLAQRILEIPEPEPVGDELDAREDGSLLHEVVADALAALRDADLLPLVGGDRTEAENAVALGAAERTLAAWEERERTGPMPLWSLRREQIRGAVLRLLESERRRRSELVPVLFEAPFGEEGEPPLLLPSPTGDEAIALRGRVDRLDRSADGTEALVVDYKSGRVDGRVKADEIGRSAFQLAVYALWAKAQSGAAEADAMLLSLRDGETSPTLRQVCRKAELPLDALLETDPERRALARNGEPLAPAAGAVGLPEEGDPNLADAAWAFLSAMREGRFDVAPWKGGQGCERCRYATLCRIGAGPGESE